MIPVPHFQSGPQLLATRLLSCAGHAKVFWAIAVIGITVAGMAFSTAAFAQTVYYAISEIQGPGVPDGLNNLGDVAGRAFDPSTGEARATKWNHGRLRQAVLGKLVGGDYSAASKINDLGQVVGAGNITNSIVPFVWTSGLGFRRIPVLPGDNCGQGASINRFGHVVGYSSGPRGKRAFLWTHGNTTRDLGVLPGSTYSIASDLNDSDEVVGTSGSTAGDRAVLWTSSGHAIDLGTLPGDISSNATGINNSGTVIGYSKGFQGTHAFVWTQRSGMQPLGVLPGETSSRALSINDADTVVGSATTSTGDRAFVWTKEAGIQDLNNEASLSMGVVLVEAHAINQAGQILALGMNMHEMEGANPAEVCAPAPPASFLLTPP